MGKTKRLEIIATNICIQNIQNFYRGLSFVKTRVFDAPLDSDWHILYWVCVLYAVFIKISYNFQSLLNDLINVLSFSLRMRITYMVIC